MSAAFRRITARASEEREPNVALRSRMCLTRTRNARAFEAAIAVWNFGEILLVIFFRKVERRRGRDFGGDFAEAFRCNRVLVRGTRRFCLG